MSLVWSIIIPLYLLCWVLIPVGAIWASQRWWKSEPKFEPPKWRSCLAFSAFSLGGLSVLLWFALAAFALLRGGFRFYDSFLLRCFGIGLILGLAGFAFSLPGKGKLRWPACFISFSMMFVLSLIHI